MVDDSFLPRSGFTRASDLVKFLPIAKSTLWKWSKDGRFPKPTLISKTITAWDNALVWEWFESHGIDPIEIKPRENFSESKNVIEFEGIEDIGTFVQRSDFMLADTKQIIDSSFSFKKIIGIYFLIRKLEIVYIGQSIDVASRISAHERDKRFDAVSVIRCEADELDAYESLYIWKYQPCLNGKFSQSKTPYAAHTPLSLKDCIEAIKVIKGE